MLMVVDMDAPQIKPQRSTWRPKALARFLGNLPHWLSEDVLRTSPGTLWNVLRLKAKAAGRRVANLLGFAPAPSALEVQGVFDPRLLST